MCIIKLYVTRAYQLWDKQYEEFAVGSDEAYGPIGTKHLYNGSENT